MPYVQLRHYTASDSLGSFSSFRASWARMCPSFATFAAYGDFATGVLAIAALLTARIRPLFWFFVVAFNLTGATDIIVDYFHAIQTGLDVMPGQFGATYAIPIIYVPLLMITHVTAFYLLLRSNKQGD